MIMRILMLVACALALGAATFEDYERAREALARGEILPLADIVHRVETEFDARMIEVEFELKLDPLSPEGPPRAYIYEFELLTRDGRVLEVEVDAKTGSIISIESED